MTKAKTCYRNHDLIVSLAALCRHLASSMDFNKNQIYEKQLTKNHSKKIPNFILLFMQFLPYFSRKGKDVWKNSIFFCLTLKKGANGKINNKSTQAHSFMKVFLQSTTFMSAIGWKMGKCAEHECWAVVENWEQFPGETADCSMLLYDQHHTKNIYFVLLSCLEAKIFRIINCSVFIELRCVLVVMGKQI